MELIGFKFLVLLTTFNGSGNLTFVKIDIYHFSVTGRDLFLKMEGIFHIGEGVGVKKVSYCWLLHNLV